MAVFGTHISWTNSTWNPAVGCTKVSAGCDNCYAEGITVHRLGHAFDGSVQDGERPVAYVESRREPRRRR